MFRRLLNLSLWMSALGLFLLVYALLIEPSRLVIREVDFQSQAYSGPDLRIALITDIHINGLHVPPERVKDLVNRTNDLSVDLVLLPGDFIAGHVLAEKRSPDFNENIETGIGYLSGLDAPSFATIGNHDAWYNAALVTTLLDKAGVSVLENRSEVFGKLCIVGLADALTSTPDRLAYSECPTSNLPLVFTHSPDAWQAFRNDSLLALAGHTHGGQVNLPLIGRRVNAISLGAEHSYGFSTIGGVDMFVSAGVGTSMLPIRFRAPPEIVVITLRSSQE